MPVAARMGDERRQEGSRRAYEDAEKCSRAPQNAEPQPLWPASAELRGVQNHQNEYAENALQNFRRQGGEYLRARECTDDRADRERHDQVFLHVAPHHEHAAGPGAELDHSMHGYQHAKGEEESHTGEQQQSACGSGDGTEKSRQGRRDDKGNRQPETDVRHAQKIFHHI